MVVLALRAGRTLVAATIWTIGYEGHDPESFIGTLRTAKIARLVDIRELPLSRKSGFSKSALALGLSKAGIGYSHVKALGTPRVTRHEYIASRGPRRAKRDGVAGETTRPAGRVGKAGGSFEAFRDAYLAHLDTVPAAVRELEEVARKERCALMCVEHEAAACHRSVLAGVLAARGWRVVHL